MSEHESLASNPHEAHSVYLNNGGRFTGTFTVFSDMHGRPVFLRGSISDGHMEDTQFGPYDNVTFPIEAIAFWR